jgi:hypothetical protein
MSATEAPELARLARELDDNEREARTIVEGLTEGQGTARARPDAWSVAECFDHLATANRVYIDAMRQPAAAALAAGKMRRRPALPGVLGGWFARSLEPPPRPGRKLKAPQKIKPRVGPPLSDAFDAFIASQADVRTFLRTYAVIDLAGVRFPNPFIPGLRFSLATGLHVITAHERRHLWQARRARESAESTVSSSHGIHEKH